MRRTPAPVDPVSRNASWFISNVFSTTYTGAGFSESMSMSKNGLLLASGASNAQRNPDSTFQYGAVHLFKFENNEWIEDTVIENPTLNLEDSSNIRNFGKAIEVSNDFIAITAYNTSTYANIVYVYSVNDTSQPLAELVSPSHEYLQNFGWSLAIENNKLIVGATESSTYGGKVFVYEFISNEFVLIQTILPEPDLTSFGFSVKTLNDSLIISVPGKNNNLSGVSVYTLSQGQYVYDYILNDPSPTDPFYQSGDAFGRSLCLTDKYLIIGAPYSRAQLGRVYIYEKINGTWTYSSAIDGPLSMNNANLGSAYTGELSNSFAMFGRGVSVFGERLVIGADFENGNSSIAGGSVYVFERNVETSEWENKVRFLNPVTADAGYFGFNVICTSANIIVGAWANDFNPANSGTIPDNDNGAMYIYKHDVPPVTKSTPASVITASGTHNFIITQSTNHATVNTVNVTINLIAGQVLRFGTTNIYRCSLVGDSVIKLLDPSMNEIGVNDDHQDSSGNTPSLPNGDSDYGSFIRHTVSETGTYAMVVGGYGETLCSGTLSWEVLT